MGLDRGITTVMGDTCHWGAAALPQGVETPEGPKGVCEALDRGGEDGS